MIEHMSNLFNYQCKQNKVLLFAESKAIKYIRSRQDIPTRLIP